MICPIELVVYLASHSESAEGESTKCHKLKIEPESPDPKLNALPSKPPLLPPFQLMILSGAWLCRNKVSCLAAAGEWNY